MSPRLGALRSARFHIYLFEEHILRSSNQSTTCASLFPFRDIFWAIAKNKSDLTSGMLLARGTMCALGPHILRLLNSSLAYHLFGSPFEQLGRQVRRYGANLTLETHRSDHLLLTYKLSSRSSFLKTPWTFCTLLEWFSLTYRLFPHIRTLVVA
jgi:hypothetical protein